jgi:hypothetical protein
MLTGWNNAGPVIIGATTTAPTKGTIVSDFTRYRKVGPREYQVQYVYNQNGAGSSGNGAYLFTLPAGLQFDFTSSGQTLSTANDGTLRNLGLPGGSAGMVMSSQTVGVPFAAPSIVIPYSATQFRILSYNTLGGNIGTMTVIGSNAFQLADVQVSFNLDFSFIATA